MRNLKTGEPFKFEVKEGDRAYNQKHYEALGEVGSCTVQIKTSFIGIFTADLFFRGFVGQG